MTGDELRFRAAVVAAPADDLPRRAYADWLIENGRAAEGGFVLDQLALAALGPPPAVYRDQDVRSFHFDGHRGRGLVILRASVSRGELSYPSLGARFDLELPAREREGLVPKEYVYKQRWFGLLAVATETRVDGQHLNYHVGFEQDEHSTPWPGRELVRGCSEFLASGPETWIDPAFRSIAASSHDELSPSWFHRGFVRSVRGRFAALRGLLPRVVLLHPIEEVEVVGKHPLTMPRTGMTPAHVWASDVRSPARVTTHILPGDVFSRLNGGTVGSEASWNAFRVYEHAQDAYADLNQAVLARARVEAGLPPTA